MTNYTDNDAKAHCADECAKRNLHISRFHPCRWKPLWDCSRGWSPKLRPVKGRA